MNQLQKQIDMAKTLELYSDGSCMVHDREKPGTCAYVVVDGQKVIHKAGYKYGQTTNNRMELMGVVKAMEWIDGKATDGKSDVGRCYIHMDSQYVQLGMTGWLANWKKKGWKTATKKPVVNQDLWMQLDKLQQKLPMVQFQWVRGHNSNKFNELADKLCEEAYKQISEEEKTAQTIICTAERFVPIKNYENGRQVGMIQGLSIGIAQVLRAGYDSIASDIWRGAGLTIRECIDAGVDEYDLQVIMEHEKELI